MKANYNKSKMTKADQRKLMGIIGSYMNSKGLGLNTPDYMGEVENKPATNNDKNKEKRDENEN